jgi:hypothetical protein
MKVKHTIERVGKIEDQRKATHEILDAGQYLLSLYYYNYDPKQPMTITVSIEGETR